MKPITTSAWICSVVLAFLLGISCSPGINLDRIPVYNAQVIGEHIQPLAKLEEGFSQLAAIALTLSPMPASSKSVLTAAVDQYSYWTAVATIHMYNQNWDAMQKACDRAQLGLKAFADELRKVIKSQRANNQSF